MSVAARPIENGSSSAAGPFASWDAGAAIGSLPAACVGSDVGYGEAQAPSSAASPMPATVIIRSGIAETIWQARDVDLPQPDQQTPHLADVVPSVLAAMGVGDFETRIDLAGEIRGACVLLVDGLGAELLDAHAEDAPVMAELRGQTLQAGFPSTTVAGLAAVGTGCRSGEHGLVGHVVSAARRRSDERVALAPSPVGRRSSRQPCRQNRYSRWPPPSSGRRRRVSR